MISKETFIRTIEKLQALDEKFNNLNEAFRQFNGDFCEFYIFEPFDIVLELLEEVMDDKDGWLAYFVFEQDWLKDLQSGDVTVGNEPVDLSDWGKVYDFLMEGKEND